MLFCPNYDCPYRVRHGRAAEYLDGTERCSDCGTAPTGNSTPTVKEAADAELGPPLGDPILVRPSPLGALLPMGGILTGAAVVLAGGFVGLIAYFGFGLIASASVMLQHRWRGATRILPHEHGFVVSEGGNHTALPASRIEKAQVSARELRLLGMKLGDLHDLTLVVDGRPKMYTGFARGSDPFVEFARALADRSVLR